MIIRGAPRTGKTSLFHALQGRLSPAALQFAFASSATAGGDSSDAEAAISAFYHASPSTVDAAAEPTPEVQSAKVGWRLIPPEGYFASAIGSASPFGLLGPAVTAAHSGFSSSSHSNSNNSGSGSGSVGLGASVMLPPGSVPPSSVTAAAALYATDYVTLDLIDLVDSGLARLQPAASLPPAQRHLAAAAATTVAPTDPRHPAHARFQPSPALAYGPWYVQLRQQAMLAALVTVPAEGSASAVARAVAAATAVRTAATLSLAAEAALAAGASPAAVAAVTAPATAWELLAGFNPVTSFQFITDIPAVPLAALPSVDASMLSDPYSGAAAMVRPASFHIAREMSCYGFMDS